MRVCQLIRRHVHGMHPVSWSGQRRHRYTAVRRWPRRLPGLSLQTHRTLASVAAVVILLASQRRLLCQPRCHPQAVLTMVRPARLLLMHCLLHRLHAKQPAGALPHRGITAGAAASGACTKLRATPTWAQSVNSFNPMLSFQQDLLQDYSSPVGPVETASPSHAAEELDGVHLAGLVARRIVLRRRSVLHGRIWTPLCACR
jgi:hypothetical protein